MREWLLAGIISVCGFGSASALCDPRSFFDTASVQSTDIQNLALAYNVTEGHWNSVKSGGGASASIYGVPVSADYSSFKSSVREKALSLGYSNFEYQSLSIATTTLTDKNLAAYKACAITASPLSIVNEGGASSAYNLSIQYSPAIGTSPNQGKVLHSLNLLDSDVQALKDRFASLVPGPFFENTILRPTDPNQESALSIGTAYHSTSIVLVPLKPPPSKPPVPPTAAAVKAAPLIDLDKVHGGAEVRLTINSDCKDVGSLACGGIYDGKRATSSNTWSFGGYNSAHKKWRLYHYQNASNAPGNLSLWGILLTYDDAGNVYRDGESFGRVAYKH